MEVGPSMGWASVGRAGRMKRVVLSCTPDSTYDFFLPISERIWRQVGYEPIIFVVGTVTDWKRGHRRAALDEVSASVKFINRISGIPDANIAMSIRQHASALLDLNPSDLILIGDIDLFPIRKDFYHQHDPSRVPVVIYHSDMYWDNYWPAYGPSMTVEIWREVMDLIVGDLQGSLFRTFQNGKIGELIKKNKKNHTDSSLWVFDEKYASVQIKKSRFFGEIVRIKTNENDRLCKNKWPVAVDLNKYIDCHCPRPGWSDGNYEKIRSVIAQAFPDILVWFDRYVELYRATRPLIADPFA